MMYSTTYKPGDIVLIPFPYSDLLAIKKRPGVVIKSAGNDLILLALTTNLENKFNNDIIIDNIDTTDGKLPSQSLIKITKVFTLEHSLVVKILDTIKPQIYKKIIEKFIQQFI